MGMGRNSTKVITDAPAGNSGMAGIRGGIREDGNPGAVQVQFIRPSPDSRSYAENCARNTRSIKNYGTFTIRSMPRRLKRCRKTETSGLIPAALSCFTGRLLILQRTAAKNEFTGSGLSP